MGIDEVQHPRQRHDGGFWSVEWPIVNWRGLGPATRLRERVVEDDLRFIMYLLDGSTRGDTVSPSVLHEYERRYCIADHAVVCRLGIH